MASIPGWAYLIVGGAIAIFSRYVSAKNPSGALTTFFWVGLILLAVGVFKLAAGYITGAKDSLVKDFKPKEEAQGTRIRSNDERPDHARDFIYCTRCNAKLHPRSRYCNWCGTKV